MIDERYEIVSKLGSGGMATVYRATRRLIGDTVAIKILHPEQVRDPQSAERFRREAQAAARLKHPNAVTIHDFGVSSDGLIYLVMELVEGKSLRAMIKEEGPQTPSTAAEILRQVCAALQEAHKQNIVHRDIKPHNIVVDVTPMGLRVKVLDFGIARMRDIAAANITQTGSVMGTPHYMSPEQCLGEELDHRSDIYSLGIVLFEMLAGIVPFNSPTSTAVAIQHVNQSPPPLRVININVPPAVEAVVLHALSKRREDRPQSAQLLAQGFDNAVDGNAIPVTAEIARPIPAVDALASAPTKQMSMPVWGISKAQAPQALGRSESRGRKPWIWVAAAAVPIIAGAGWSAHLSSTHVNPGFSYTAADSAGVRPYATTNSIGNAASPAQPTNTMIPVAPAQTTTNQLSGALPEFRAGTPYPEVRQMLMALGWRPVTLPTASPCRDDRCRGFPEVYFCAGTGQAVCTYMWKKEATLLRVFGRGESTGQEYYSLKPCPLHPTQFDPECEGEGRDSVSTESEPKVSGSTDCAFCGTWDYVGDFTQGHLRLNQAGTNKFKFVASAKGIDGKAHWDDSHAVYLTTLNGRLVGTFVTSNFLYSTDGDETTYKITCELISYNKMRYSVWSAARGGEPLEFVATKVSN